MIIIFVHSYHSGFPVKEKILSIIRKPDIIMLKITVNTLLNLSNPIFIIINLGITLS